MNGGTWTQIAYDPRGEIGGSCRQNVFRIEKYMKINASDMLFIKACTETALSLDVIEEENICVFNPRITSFKL